MTTPNSVTAAAAGSERALTWALLFGNFVIGTGILLPAGMLTELAAGLAVTVPTAGTLMLASGIVVGIGAPVFAALTSALDRRLLLTAAMALYVMGHLASAFAPSFEVLLLIRIVMVIAAAIYTPQAAATIGALLPAERRPAAITFVFLGWAIASVAGMPLGGLIAHALGWRAAFAVTAALALMAALWTWRAVPGGVRIPVNFASWKEVATSPVLLLVLLVTVLSGSGQFTLFTYINPALKAGLEAGPTLVTAILVSYGIAATIGNFAAAHAIARIGASRAVLISLLSMVVGLALWGAGSGSIVAVAIAAVLWGLGTFSTNSMQQARLAGLAPHLASASIALNTSAIYIGQAVGSALGGTMIARDAMPSLPWTGLSIVAAAAAVSVLADRLSSRRQQG